MVIDIEVFDFSFFLEVFFFFFVLSDRCSIWSRLGLLADLLVRLPVHLLALDAAVVRSLATRTGPEARCIRSTILHHPAREAVRCFGVVRGGFAGSGSRGGRIRGSDWRHR